MTQTNKPLLFRFHKGRLEDSMKTVRQIDSFEFLIWLINHDWDFRPIAIKVSPYVYDERIHWDTHIVSARFKGLENDGFMPVGFLNRKPEWSIKDYEQQTDSSDCSGQCEGSDQEPQVPCQIL